MLESLFLFGRSNEVSKTLRASFVTRGRSHISALARSLISRVRRAAFRWASPSPIAYGFLCELRSFLHRTLSLRTLYESGVDVGNFLEPHEHGSQTICDRTRGRMLSTRRLRKDREWSSMGDVQVYLQGWEEGARWASSGTDNQCSHKTRQSQTP
jgi:hypothetical protein